jgi:Pro-kumamolisin, activation domain/Putative Ig domain
MGRMIGRVMVAIAALGVSVAAPAATAGATVTLDRIGAAPAIPLSATTSTLTASTHLHITVAMRPQDASGLQALATGVSTPGSPEFRHFLTEPQFAARFGASGTALSAVESELTANGLAVGEIPANHLSIPASGTAAQIERAFSVSMQQVKLASGRTAFANAQAPALPASIGQYVQGVVGLDDLNPPQPAGLERYGGEPLTDPSIHPSARTAVGPEVRPDVATGGPQPCTAALKEQSSFEAAVASNLGVPAFPQTADEAATAYSFPPLYRAGDLGQGQTIAMFEEQAYDPTDIAAYQSCYGTSVPITNVTVDGGPGTCTSTSCPGGDGEAALDIEQVVGLAPKASILVYQGPSDGSGVLDILSSIVSQDRAREISSSFGVCEAATGTSVMTGENTLLREAAVQGQSFFASSGDSGAEMCSQLGGGDFGLSVEDPAAQPFATGVGGTTLTADGPPPTESVWNDGPNPECNCTPDSVGGGTGGGISAQWPMPGYQSSASPALGVINSNSSGTPCGGGAADCREVPDVSADGDLLTGYVIFDGGNWDVIGGTSASTPLWAAYTALVNASAGCRGQSIGFANPALYQVAARGYAANFNDATAASPYTGFADNDTFQGFETEGIDPSDLFPLRPGYDLATGLGTPIGATLAGWLCGIRYAVSVTNPGAQSTVAGQAVALQIQAGDSGGLGVRYGASGLPAGLSINAATGLISGTPTTAGTSTVTVAATDAFANNGATQFSWTVVPGSGPSGPLGPPVKPGAPFATGASLSGLAARKAKLKLTVHAGSNAPAIKSVKIALPSGLSFVKAQKTLRKGISVRGAKFTAKLTRGTLTLTFAKAVRQATITIAPPAIAVNPALAAKARHPKHGTLVVKVTTINSARRAITLPERFRL